MKKYHYFSFAICLIAATALVNLSHAGVDGKIILADGEVTVNGKSAKIGDIVSFGDEIAVGGKSSCEIVVAGDSIVKIRNNARMIFKIDDTEKSSIDLVKGWFSAIFRKKNVTVRTPTVIAGIRGTILCINVENEQSVYTCTCNGTIDWKGEGKPVTITASHHEARYFRIEDGKTVSSHAGMLYHTDKDIDAMAAKINTTIDRTKTE